MLRGLKRSKAGTLGRQNARTPERQEARERPSPTGRAVHGFFPPADLSSEWLLREKPCGATLGERFSNRVSAYAVGRRGLFLKGRKLPLFDHDAP